MSGWSIEIWFSILVRRLLKRGSFSWRSLASATSALAHRPGLASESVPQDMQKVAELRARWRVRERQRQRPHAGERWCIPQGAR